MSNDIILNEIRVGNFTSSNIWKLTKSDRKGDGFGAPALTYIQEKAYEKKLKRSLDTGAYSRDMAWGIFLEKRVFDLIGLEYTIKSDETNQHPDIDGWAGSADLIVPETKVSDIKCYGLKNFCAYADVLEQKNIGLLKDLFPKEYWQLVSNAIINSVPNGEAILYSPYVSELEEIQRMAADYDEVDMWKYRFIYESQWFELSVLPDDSGYKNINIFEFTIPQEDIDFLTMRVKMAIELRDQLVIKN